MIGVLIINKPAGMTSHDVVNVVRRITGTRRVGHTGTLDPMATGVLVLLVGPATRLSQFVTGHQKIYQASIRLGQTTTTYDADGEITHTHPINVTCDDVESALEQFHGPIQQLPPMYSAVSINGQRLYKLARQGKEVEREPRSVTIHQLMMRDCSLPNLTLDVVCSSGTYIRSLAHDLGQVLGCGAHLTALQRRAVGEFRLEQSYALDELRVLTQDERLSQALLPPQTALSAMPSVKLDTEQEQAVRYGQVIHLEVETEADMLQAHDLNSHLIGVLICIEPATWRPKLVLPKDE